MKTKKPLTEEERIKRAGYCKAWRDKQIKNNPNYHAEQSAYQKQRRIKQIKNDPEYLKNETATHRVWLDSNPGYLKDYRSRCTEKDSDYIKKKNLKRNYGITLEEWNKLLTSQNGRCAICRKPSEDLCVDHDHITNKIRGLLCRTCNIALGNLNDDPELFKSAINYLQKYK